ncbi:MAG TPA: spore coat U domain-containing protein [Kofleriaceae bacterium]|nr:spore coat U domain-containing protein [Kofleriaceae bacterium]
MKRVVLIVLVWLAHARDAHAFCSITQVNPVSFGSYDVFASGSTVIAPVTIVVACDGSYSAYLDISLGTSSTSFASRQLVQAGQPNLAYAFYLDAAHTTLWGDGTGGSSKYAWTTAKNTTYNITVYGVMTAGQDVAVGSYAEPTSLQISLTDKYHTYQTTSLAVSATVAQRCTIATGSLAFGSYDPVTANAASGADLLATGASAVTVHCTRGTSPAPSISLGAGLYPSSAFNRRMASGSNRLAYQIYTSSARTTVWGDGTAGTTTQSVATPVASMLTAQAFTAYGKIAKGQDVAVGSYTDTVTATVNF